MLRWGRGGGAFSNCRNKKWGLSPTWDDRSVGRQQSVPSNQQDRELEYWPTRAPKRVQSPRFSFYLLWQRHTVHPCESPFFYSLQWFIINCTERTLQSVQASKYHGEDHLTWSRVTSLKEDLKGLFELNYELFRLDQSTDAVTKNSIRDDNCHRNLWIYSLQFLVSCYFLVMTLF